LQDVALVAHATSLVDWQREETGVTAEKFIRPGQSAGARACGGWNIEVPAAAISSDVGPNADSSARHGRFGENGRR